MRSIHCLTVLFLSMVLAPTPASGDTGALTPALLDRLDDSPVRVILYRKTASAPADGLPTGAIGLRRSRAAVAETPLRRALSDRGVTGVTSLWAIDALAFTATPDTVRAIAARPDVDRVDLDRLYEGPKVEWTPAPAEGDVTVPWNLSRIGADALWAEGVDGTGVTIGIIDTGIQADHPDLAGRLLPGGWFDAVEGNPAPYDDHWHGTHVAGTAVGGSSRGEAIGVAPGASLVVAKALNQSNRFFFSWVVAAGQWMADPNGDGNPSDAPDVINCSWSFDALAETAYGSILDLWRSAGAVPVFAAGNNGPGLYTTGSPGNHPTAFSVGATASSDIVADFSGRGSAPMMHPFNGILKPDISAPGVSILSTMPNSVYGYASGTSMAAPHVAGAVALVRQAHPALDIAGVLARLTATARDRGAPGPDTLYGHGLLDVHAAVHMATGYVPPALSGLVTGLSGAPIHNAIVDASGTRVPTGPDGRFSIPNVGPASVSVMVDAPGYAPLTLDAPTGVETVFPLTPRVESAISNGGEDGEPAWQPIGTGGLERTNSANRTPGGSWSYSVSNTGSGTDYYWLTERTPISMGGVLTVNAMYSWRGVGNVAGRTSGLVWEDGAGRIIGIDFGVPSAFYRRGGEADGVWRTEIQAFRTPPPPEAAWVRLLVGAYWSNLDPPSEIWFDDVSLDFNRAPGAGAVVGAVHSGGVLFPGAVVGVHPFGRYYTVTDANGWYVLVIPAGDQTISAWAPGWRPSSPETVNVPVGDTVSVRDHALEPAGTNFAPLAAHTASSTLDGDHLPGQAADGNTVTIWSSAIGYGAPNAPVWWAADLGAMRPVRSVEVEWEQQPVIARISVSLDGVYWTPFAEGNWGWIQGAGHTISVLRLDNLPVRYIRVEDVASNATARVGLREVRILVPPAGDADGNGVVDTADVVAVLRAVGGLARSAPIAVTGDVHPAGGDGVLQLADALVLARYLWDGGP